MRELSLHIMDIAENGLNADATFIHISIVEEKDKNRLFISIKDNGKGMSPDDLNKVTDPFFTSRTTRRVGLGLSLFREASLRCKGDFDIRSTEGQGTEVTATFRLDHIDLAPMGDMAGTFTSLIMGNSDVDFLYSHEIDGDLFELDTREIKAELDDLPINNPKVLIYLGGLIKEFTGNTKKTSE